MGTDRSTRDWRLIREEARPGPETMALDEIAARTAADGGPRTVRLYRWDPSCLSLGYNQDPETIDWDACAERGIEVTRRQTGGGAIYHDIDGDVSYSVIAPAAEFPSALLEAYHVICEPLFDALAELGIDAEYVDEEQPGVYEPACYLRPLHPAHDIVAAGRKLSGNAQYRQRDAVIQHGSLSVSLDPERHLAGFTDPPNPATFEERVTGVTELVSTDRTTIVETLETRLKSWAQAVEGHWTETELAAARDLAESKYRNEAWVRHGNDPT